MRGEVGCGGGTADDNARNIRNEAEQHRARLAAIVDSSSDAIIGKTMEGIVTSWNRGAERLYGYTPDEAIGVSIALIIPPDLPDELPRIMSRLRRGERIEHYRTERIRKDGGRLHVDVSVSPVRDAEGRITGAAAIARDVTDQVRAEEERSRLLAAERDARLAAERAERKLAFLAEASSVLAGSLDYETTLANVAELAIPRVADWCSVSILDKTGELQPLAVMHVDPTKIELARQVEERYPSRPEDASGTYEIMRSGRPLLVEEVTDEMLIAGARDEDHLRLLRSLGLTSVMSVPLKARDRDLGVITFAMAESGRRHDRDDLALGEDLARRAALAVDNARLYQEVQEALGLREEFLSIASHELKTPLTALQLQVQVLQRSARRAGDGTAALSPEAMDAIERQVRRLTRLTSDLLDVSRISSGRFELERADTDLAALVHDVAARFAEELAASGSEVTIDAARRVVGCWDRDRLDQVVSNLLSNAIKYGQGRPIEMAAGDTGDWAWVSVADRGIGIAGPDTSRIFDRFIRVETPERAGGLGLGLYIVQQIVEAHGGTVRVDSKPGCGSTFTVWLPRPGVET